MTEPKSKSGSKQIASRFDPDTYERLQRMSRDAGENVAEIVRQLIARSLADDGTIELVTTLNAMATRLAAIEQQQATALPVLAAICRRVVGLEQLLCRIDGNAVSRRATDHAITWKLLGQIHYEALLSQNAIFATFEAAKALQGENRTYCLDYWAELVALSKQGFKLQRAELQQICAGIESGDPARLELEPPSRDEKQTLAKLLAVLEATTRKHGQDKPAGDDEEVVILGDEEELEGQAAALNGATRASRSANGGAAS